ncbi:MAG TPA: GNAT family N-acetyltransferase [Methylomirabilota bacterium]|nr:GNAT family N-acetyltransferase [Methylomirabilota bacterium]
MSNTPLSVECLTRLPEMHALRGEWQNLLDAARQPTVFQTWEWVTSWYEHFGEGKALRLLIARDEEGRLVGVAPGSRSSVGLGSVRLLHLLGRGNDFTEYVDAILHPAHADAVARAFFEAWDREGGAWDLLVLPSVPADGDFLPRVRALAATRGYRAHVEEHVRVTRPLPDSWEAFYRSLRKSMKDNVNNYLNRLRREGHEERLRVVEDPADLEAALETLFDLHGRRAQADLGRRHDDYFARPGYRAFLKTVAHRLMARGFLWPAMLDVDGQTVAAQLCLVHAGRFYTYYSGYDPDWARYGVMTVLTRRCIERAIAHGCRELDLLLGMDQEKLRWGGEPRPVVNLVLASRRWRSRMVFHLHGARRNGHPAWWRRLAAGWSSAALPSRGASTRAA